MTGRRFVLWSTAIALLAGGALIVPAEGSDESGASADVTYEYDWATINAHRRSDENHAKAWTEDHFNIRSTGSELTIRWRSSTCSWPEVTFRT